MRDGKLRQPYVRRYVSDGDVVDVICGMSRCGLHRSCGMEALEKGSEPGGVGSDLRKVSLDWTRPKKDVRIYFAAGGPGGLVAVDCLCGVRFANASYSLCR